MLVTFKTSAHADITMFGSAAVSLLKMMGHSGTVPGAIMSADISEALDKLQAGVAAGSTAESDSGSQSDTGSRADQDQDEPPPVPLATRAQPLIELLTAAREAGENVMWEE